MSGFDITIILDKKDRTLPKPINNRPGYDLKYIESYIRNYFGYYTDPFKPLFDSERLYDKLSIMKQGENPNQWVVRVRANLQYLLSEKKYSVYHRYCLFASFGKEKLINFDYYRPSIHRSRMAICLGCMKLTQTWRNYKKRPESLASQIWNVVKNDNTLNDKKFLGLTSYKVKYPQTRNQFNLWIAEMIAMYRRDNPDMLCFFLNRNYEEYYIPYDWIGDKKYQLHDRLHKHVVDLLRERGHRIVNPRSWYEMIKWADKPDKYLNNKNFIRIE
nr:7928_t:CDS:2 [Entrophospora candida]